MSDEQRPFRRREVLRVARTMPDGRLGMLEKPLEPARPRLNRADQLAQATAMYHRRLFGGAGGAVAAIAEQFDVNESTVRRRLAQARRDGVPDEAREAFITDMLPLAMAVVKQAMSQTDDMKLAVAAAKMVIEGLDAMKLPAAEGNSTTPGPDDSYEVWRERIKIVRKTDTSESAVVESSHDATAATVLDGHCVGGGDIRGGGLLPEAPTVQLSGRGSNSEG